MKIFLIYNHFYHFFLYRRSISIRNIRHLPNLLPHLQIIPLDNPRRQIHHHHHRSVPDTHVFLYFHAIAIPEPENIRNLHLIIDKMDFPVLHHPFIQPVIKNASSPLHSNASVIKSPSTGRFSRFPISSQTCICSWMILLRFESSWCWI